MDRLVAQLSSLDLNTCALSYHERRALLRLVRLLRHPPSNTTSGAPAVRYRLAIKILLDDALDFLSSSSTGSASSSSSVERLSQLRDLLRKLQDALKDPKVSIRGAKRPRELLESETSAPQVLDGLPGSVSPSNRTQKKPRRVLEDAQMLYDYLHPLDGQRGRGTPSVSSLFQSAITDDSVSRSQPGNVEGFGASSLSDLWEEAKELIPLRGRMIQERERLDDLFSDTSAQSSTQQVEHLSELADLLSQLCAPVRDEQTRAALSSIAIARERISLGRADSLIQDALRQAFTALASLVKDMKDDMKRFSMGVTAASTSEAEMKEMMRVEAQKREREAVEDLFGRKTAVNESSKAWVAEKLGQQEAPLNRETLVIALLETIFSSEPVTLPRPSAASAPNAASSNALPAILYIQAKRIHLAQNRLQALTILATLATLVPSKRQPPHTSVSSAANGSTEMSWSARVWLLLSSELQPAQTTRTSNEHLKLANISDEIVAATCSQRTVSEADEVKLRESVSRMLSISDPVYKLLSGRLKQGLKAALLNPVDGITEVKGYVVVPLPAEIRQIVDVVREIVEWAAELWQIPA